MSKIRRSLLASCIEVTVTPWNEVASSVTPSGFPLLYNLEIIWKHVLTCLDPEPFYGIL